MWWWYLFQCAVMTGTYALVLYDIGDDRHAYGMAPAAVAIFSGYAATWLLVRLIGWIQRYRYSERMRIR